VEWVGHYILKGREPVAVSLEEWMRWWPDADRVVARTRLASGVTVSTVFLALDPNFHGDGPPLLFETMVFDAPSDPSRPFGEDRLCRRYPTWADAEIGHMEVCEMLEPDFLFTGRAQH